MTDNSQSSDPEPDRSEEPQDSTSTGLFPRGDALPQVSPLRDSIRGRTESAEPSGQFWSRYKTLINFWLDIVLLILFLVQAWELSILRFAFPKGSGERWRLLGHSAADWQDLAFNTFCVFATGIVLHVMLHWSWIVATIQTRLLHQNATRDDGSHTLMGVGLLFVLIHLLAGGILWARWAIVES